MLDAIRALFSSKPKWQSTCETCEALRGTIQVLKDDNVLLWGQINILQEKLFQATHLTAPVAHVKGETPESISLTPPTWNSVKRRLEEKHRRKPEDAVAQSWEKKIGEMEKEAGIAS